MAKGIFIVLLAISAVWTQKLSQLEGNANDDVLNFIAETLRHLPIKFLHISSSYDLMNIKTSVIFKYLHHEWLFYLNESHSSGSVLIVFASEEIYLPKVKLSDWLFIVVLGSGNNPESVIHKVDSRIYHSGLAIIGLDVYTWVPAEICLGGKRIRWVDRWIPGQSGGTLRRGGHDLSLEQGICDLGGCTLKCGTFEWPPFIMTVADNYSTNQIVVPGRKKFNSGLEILMLHVISEKCNASFEFQEYPIQTWDKLSADVKKGELDIAAAALMFTDSRWNQNFMAVPYLLESFLWCVN